MSANEYRNETLTGVESLERGIALSTTMTRSIMMSCGIR